MYIYFMLKIKNDTKFLEKIDINKVYNKIFIWYNGNQRRVDLSEELKKDICNNIYRTNDVVTDKCYCSICDYLVYYI